MPPNSRTSGEKPALTGFRGLGAIGVFFTHLPFPAAIAAAHPLLIKFKEVGWVGVPVFFVLSGYLITWLAIEERRRTGAFDLRRFYIRRGLRIYPLYYAASVIGLTLWFWPATRIVTPSPKWAVPLLTLTVNYPMWIHHTIAGLGALGTLWTVAVEVHFYLVWAFVLRFAPRNHIVLWALGGVAASLVFRVRPGDVPYFLIYRMHPGVAIGTVMLGCLLAACEEPLRRRVGDRDPSLLIVAGVICIAILGWPLPRTIVGDGALVAAVDALAAITVFACAGRHGFVARLLSIRPLRYLGDTSYAFYVFHLVLITAYVELKPRHFAALPNEREAPWLSLGV